MTGHKGNSEFCYPETLNVPRGEAERNIEVEGKQNSLFPEGPVIKCFVIPLDSKIEKAPKKIICLRPLHTLAALDCNRLQKTALDYFNLRLLH